ncbi:hypothetical protein [uncultured Porticoccus sp.]|uniref:hypothetical protein n=1 Tax=uncultured Porticoccus sp. TaxID=1256050 RepID=UPI00262DA0FC|nr:hypothetical protein [uncultured Porticoccus sp.]
MNKFLLLLLLLPFSAQASLECKGSSFGLDFIYLISTGENKNLVVEAKTFLKGEIIIEQTGVATYSSTVRVRSIGEQESYYVFAPDIDSYTEIFALSKDLKSMGRSRPEPVSDTGNFIKFRCTGFLD